MDPQEVKELIEGALEGSQVLIRGDGRHFEAVVVSDAFAGKSLLEQHRMVYAALGDHFATEAVHALSFRTFTREQWAQAGG